MNKTGIVMDTLLNPVVTDPKRRHLNSLVYTEVYPCIYDDTSKLFGCGVRFFSFYDMKEHLLWHREAMTVALKAIGGIETYIKSQEVICDLAACGYNQQHVDLYVFYLQDFPSFPESSDLRSQWKSDY